MDWALHIQAFTDHLMTWVALFAIVFSWHNCPSPPYPFVKKIFHDAETFVVFCNNTTPTKFQKSSRKNHRYNLITYSSLSNILIHSLEVAKISKPASWDFFSDTNYTEHFVEFLCSNNSSLTPHIQQTIPSPAQVKQCIVSLNAGHVLQPYNKLFLIQELKILPRFLAK